MLTTQKKKNFFIHCFKSEYGGLHQQTSLLTFWYPPLSLEG